MRAVAMQGLHRPLVMTHLPDPAPGPGEVLVAVGRCGICGSDLHMTEDPAYGQGAGAVLGHEFAGEIAATGAGVEHLRAGMRVAVSPLVSCGNCAACRAGTVAWCSGFGLQGGGYAELAVARANQCVVLPESASLADGAIVEPLAVALHGVLLADLAIGDRVLILGAGPIGLAVAFWARRRGAGRVVVLDLADWQRERALQMGAHAYVASAGDPLGEAQAALGGAADVVFECVGVPGLIAQATGHVRARGTIVLLGLCTVPDTINSFAMLSKEVRLVTSAFFTTQEFAAALDALDRGALEPRLLVSQTIALGDTPVVFEQLRKRTHQCKVLIDPSD